MPHLPTLITGQPRLSLLKLVLRQVPKYTVRLSACEEFVNGFYHITNITNSYLLDHRSLLSAVTLQPLQR